MKDLKKARQLLAGEYTCVVCREDTVYTTTRRGVKPLVSWLEEGVDLRGFSAADRVIGRATAFLYVLLGVRSVWARVMSAPAAQVLRDAGIGEHTTFRNLIRGDTQLNAVTEHLFSELTRQDTAWELGACGALSLLFVRLLRCHGVSRPVLPPEHRRMAERIQPAIDHILRHYPEEIGVPALKTISLSFMFAGYCIVCSSMFQALGHGMMSLWTSVIRQLVVLLPVAFILSRVGGLSYVWYSYPIAEVFSLTLSTIFLIRIYKTNIAPLKEHE